MTFCPCISSGNSTKEPTCCSLLDSTGHEGQGCCYFSVFQDNTCSWLKSCQLKRKPPQPLWPEKTSSHFPFLGYIYITLAAWMHARPDFSWKCSCVVCLGVCVCPRTLGMPIHSHCYASYPKENLKTNKQTNKYTWIHFRELSVILSLQLVHSEYDIYDEYISNSLSANVSAASLTRGQVVDVNFKQ